MDVSITELRVLRSVAERGSFTAAAVDLGYTQSAVSRQIASLERETGRELFERRRGGVRITAAGTTLLAHARVVLDELAVAGRELDAPAEAPVVVTIGTIPSAGAVLLPELVRALAARNELRLTSREGTTPALTRAVRAGSLDLAVLALRPPYRQPDDEAPRLVLTALQESDLQVAVPASGRNAARRVLDVDELDELDWIASPPGSRGEPLLGVWPGLAGRPRIAHVAGDWLTKLSLVAAGAGVTTVPPNLPLPHGVVPVPVRGGPVERRRTVLARLPGPMSPAVRAVARAVRAALPG